MDMRHGWERLTGTNRPAQHEVSNRAVTEGSGRAAAERGGIVGALLGGILAMVLLAIVAVAIGGYYFARNVRVTETGKETRVETPVGSIRVRERARFDPKSFGVPVYPGAVREHDSKQASFEFEFGDDSKQFSILAAAYTTDDPPSKVMDFYRKELPHWIFKESRHGHMEISMTGAGYKRIIAIREKAGRTHIGLASVGEPAAN